MILYSIIQIIFVFILVGSCTLVEDIELGVTAQAKAQNEKDSNTSMKPTIKQLLVSAVSKEVRLPENEVTLSAYTVPAEQENEHYNYVWSLLSQPESHTGTMTDQNRMTVKLSNLSEGLYTFKVTVNSSNANAYGEAYANVSVLPRKCYSIYTYLFGLFFEFNLVNNNFIVIYSQENKSGTNCHNFTSFASCKIAEYWSCIRWFFE